MKTLKQLREEYDGRVLDQVTIDAPEELMLEGAKERVVPLPSQMPAMLLFRRMAYKLYPDKQVVALYYSKAVDKYLSIPFGPGGNLNLSESSIYDTYEEMELGEGAKWEAIKGGLKGAAHGAVRGAFIGAAIAPGPGTAAGAVIGGARGAYKGAKAAYNKAKDQNMEEDWQDVNRKDRTSGLSQKAVNAYRREHPGSKLQTAVTEKNPTGKRAARRKSFCSRMGGMKKRLTSAKTARDPDSRINKALRRWNCEESFKAKLYERRLQREGVVDYLDAGAEAIVPYYSAGKKLYKGDYSGAAKDAAVDTALLATGAVAGKALGAGVRGISKLAGKFGTKKVARDASAIAKSAKAPKTAPKVEKPGLLSKLKSGIGSVTSALSGSDTQGDQSSVRTSAPGGHARQITGPKTYSSWETRRSPKSSQQSRIDAAMMKDVSSSQKVQENKISDIRSMIDEGYNELNLSINGREVTLNNSMAKRILEVYDSVNTKNKKIVESMLNEDLESFKKLLNFSIKA